jgi:tetratricopeptide (TPR) repeat protein
MANAYCKIRGRRIEAQQYYQRAVESDPNLIEAHMQLGNSLFVEARFDLAIASYAKVIQLEPNHPEAHYYLGLAYRQTGQAHRGDRQLCSEQWH